ncbi:hypothetical protein NECAME_14554 [Necator americanus]|uniref:Transporter, major facilitator family protein n=1 Tax=Necator americanus TaxID=51031 RepID=W2SQ07_NECAM|nr:hypothetical protein NECAME_14554 [Necator americanus]ETN70752.1 hypothetical protein NECAME_14554 [Necator americanus]
MIRNRRQESAQNVRNYRQERARLVKRAERPHRLRLPSTHYTSEPSPCTPCSVFSFDLPNSPAVVKGRQSFGPPTPKEETSTEEITSSVDSVTSPETDWKSIRLIMFVILMTRIQFTVYFASLWPFLQEIDDSANMQDYAIISAAYSIGIAGAAPFFGYWSNKLIFSPLSYPGSVFGLLQINMYTMPAIVANVLVAVSMVLMAFFFKEAPMFREGKRNSLDSTDTQFSVSLPPFDKVAVFCCIFAKMVQMFIYANMETIGSMYTQQMFDLSRTETTQFNSILVSLSGFVGFAFLFTYVWTKLGKRVDNRVGALVGVLVCVGFLFSTYSWPFYTGNIESDACHSPWCATTPRIPWPLYAGSYVIVFGVGFAMMNVHLAAMYSGVLGPRRQGTMHGINTLLASCSRVLGPVAVTDMFWYFGPQVVWIFQFATWALLLIVLGVFYERLVPLGISQSQEDSEEIKKADQ